MSKYLLTFTPAILLCCPVAVYAQQSLFQSANGDTAIYMPGGNGAISYNLGSDAARFDFEVDHGGRSAFGGGMGGTVKSGTGAILNKSAPATGGFFEGGYIYRFVGEKYPRECTVVNSSDPTWTTSGPPPTDHNASSGPNHTGCERKEHQFLSKPYIYSHYVILQYHYQRNQFYTLSSTATPLASPTQVNFNEDRFTVAYNAMANFDTVTFHIGAAYYTAQSNNLADLKAETYQRETIVTSGSSQTTVAAASKSVYVGSYTTHQAQSLNGDFLIQPGKAFNYQLAVDLMFRSDLAGGPGVRYASPGVGLYFFKKGSVSVPLGGISYSYKAGNSSIAVVTGWTFGGTADSKK